MWRVQKKNDRKGQLAIPFHFIFALFGGIMFLLLFFILIKSVVTGSQESDTRQLSYAIETILKTSVANTNAFSVADVRSETYAFACELDDEIVESSVRISGGDYDVNALRYTPLFSPARITGDELYTSTYTWKAPFPVGNLVVASNNRTRYVFVGNTNAVKGFLEAENLEGFGSERYGSSATGSFSPQGFDQYRVVYFNTNYQSLQGLPESQWDGALVVNSPDGRYESGTLQFIDDLETGTLRAPIPFYGRAMLVAAIFAQDEARYRCEMSKVLERFSTSARIIKERASALNVDERVAPECTAIYTTAITYLDSFVQTKTLDNVDSLVQDNVFAQLENWNRRLVSQNCPLLY